MAWLVCIIDDIKSKFSNQKWCGFYMMSQQWHSQHALLLRHCWRKGVYLHKGRSLGERKWYSGPACCMLLAPLTSCAMAWYVTHCGAFEQGYNRHWASSTCALIYIQAFKRTLATRAFNTAAEYACATPATNLLRYVVPRPACPGCNNCCTK